jgi:hypothetical protein
VLTHHRASSSPLPLPCTAARLHQATGPSNTHEENQRKAKNFEKKIKENQRNQSPSTATKDMNVSCQMKQNSRERLDTMQEAGSSSS